MSSNSSIQSPELEPIDQSEWQRLAEQHRQRAVRWTEPARSRRAAGVPHPIEDFLFTYYPFSYAKLEQWHPGVGRKLAHAGGDELPAHLARSPYRSEPGFCFADPVELSEKARARLFWTKDLLEQTQGRAPNYACHGLHEWAMVYRGAQVRHQGSTALRLSQREIDEIVESRTIRCSHFDAFRFFHPDAIPMNRLQPKLLDRPKFEQPACLHANLDLYKWTSKSMPWSGSELLLDCFELARDLRELDMRASPYDLSEYDLEPVKIETEAGRREYERLQFEFASQAAPLRARLIGQIEEVLRLSD